MNALALRERLQQLPGRVPNHSVAASEDPKLAELVARIARLKGRSIARQGQTTETALASRLGGEILSPGLIVVDRSYPLWHRLGRVPLSALLQVRGEMFPDDPRQLLFLDTETTGLAGGCGTTAFMIGLGRLHASGSSFTVRQYLIAGFGAERAMLDAVANDVNDHDCLVTFNGKSYDLPLLATRYRLLGADNPLHGQSHLDLRHPLRRLYGKQFADCRLKTLEEQVLGHRRDHDLPGSEAPKAWLDWLKRREMSMLAEVARHNRGDILAMVGLCQSLVSREPADLVA